MKTLLEMIREFTDDLILKDFKAGDRDQDELSHGEVRHAVRKLKQLTDSGYDCLRKEAAGFGESGYSSESSATEEYRGQRGVLDIEWPAELIATVSGFRKSTLTLIRPRFYSRKHQGFRPRSQAAQASWDGRQTLRPRVEVPRQATSYNKAGLSLHAAKQATLQALDERKGARSSTGEREYSPAKSPLRCKTAAKPSRKP